MKVSNSLLCAFLLCASAGMGACSQSSGSGTQGDHSLLGDTIANAMDEARQKLRTENIDISSGHVGFSTGHVAGRNHAEITPRGDLLIDGKTAAVTPQQRAVLLEYRAQVIGIAEQGMQIGTQGIDFATRAFGKAISAAFNDKSHQQIHAELEDQATDLRKSAAALCARLPALRDAQQKLAASLPAFAPYATMSQADIDDCTKNAKHGHMDMGDKQANR